MKTYLIGYTQIDPTNLKNYLHDTNQEEFLWDSKLSPGENLCSFYAKLCYKSLTSKHNANISKVRSIKDNLESCIDVGHGSIFEHFQLNWVTTGCSRVFTHELVRHRVGMAYSQTSGRYVSLDKLDMVLDPLLDPCLPMIRDYIKYTEDLLRTLRNKLITEDMDFAKKKKVTSAIRRLAPNGQANEIGWSCNIRSLRHILEMRTNRAAEWEIRTIFNEVADIILGRWPHILYGHTRELVDDLWEYKGLRV